MKRSAIVFCLSAVLLWPVVVSALDVEYPTLGIKLTNLPADSKSLGAHELVNEVRAQIEFGGTSFARISRFDEPVPTGNFADEGYRDALLKQFGIHPKGGALRALSIAGEPAWGTGYALSFDPKVVAYQFALYLVYDEHLYEIAVSAVGDPRATKARFDTTTLQVTSGLGFIPLQSPPEKPLAPGEMPKFLMGSSMDHYPDRERLLGEQGVVDLEFGIDGGGAAQGVKLTNRASSDFSRVAVSMLRAGRFKVPQGWGQSGPSKQLFTMEFRFGLNCPATFPPSKVPSSHVITICATAIRAP